MGKTLIEKTEGNQELDPRDHWSYGIHEFRETYRSDQGVTCKFGENDLVEAEPEAHFQKKEVSKNLTTDASIRFGVLSVIILVGLSL